MPTKHPLSILLIDDERIVHQTIGDYLRASGHQVDDARDSAAALKALQASDYDLALLDILIPGLDGLSLLARARELRPTMPVVITTGRVSLETAVQALQFGAAGVLAKPIKLIELDAALDKAVQSQSRRDSLREKSQAAEGIRASDSPLIGTSPALCAVLDHIRQVVEMGCETILITGETGTGKEVVARQIHAQASGDDRPFIAVSCPALSESLVESELFGHMKGAFTGAAADRIGYFELAHGGTLLLDEITDFSAAAQATLLRVLETRVLRRVGGVKEIRVDVRIIAATNTPLDALVKAGKFRRDLFYRLNEYTIHLVPLRERREDILPLAEHFLSRYAQKRHLSLDGFSSDAQHVLLTSDYPGNVRELRSLVERAAMQCRSGQIQPEHLTLLTHPDDSLSPQLVLPDPDQARESILRALEDARWNRRRAARRLGMPYSTLLYRMQKLGIG